MGQAASKAKEAAKRAASDPRVSQAIQAQQTRAAAESQWKRTASAANKPGGRGEYSPTRGHNQSSATATTTSETMPEMPADLIKFLNDAGPLKRTVDKELTSSKVYDALVTDETTREEHTRQANVRVRRRMPIVTYKDHDNLMKNDERRSKRHMDATSAAALTDDDDNDYVDDGTMTTRTTNFSTRDRSATTNTEFGLDRMEMFQLALKLKQYKVNSPEWREEVENEFKQIRRKKTLSSKGDNTKDFGQLKDFALFENSMRYIGVPVLMKDTDNDIIGVPAEKEDDFRFSQGLKEVNEEKVIFVMKAEGQKDAKESSSSSMQ